jgi:ABC-type multidrug transport system permease subunit
MLRRHRNAIFIGIGCVVLAALYGGLAPVFNYHVEWAGVTMLAALGAAMGLLVAVLEAGLGD